MVFDRPPRHSYMLAASHNNTAYLPVLAIATMITKIRNGVRSKPAITVSGSPTNGIQLSSNDQTPHRAYQRSARCNWLEFAGNQGLFRMPAANLPSPQFTPAPSVLPRLATTSKTMLDAAPFACMTSNTASD